MNPDSELFVSDAILAKMTKSDKLKFCLLLFALIVQKIQWSVPFKVIAIC